jgi:hypothetical protein
LPATPPHRGGVVKAIQAAGLLAAAKMIYATLRFGFQVLHDLVGVDILKSHGQDLVFG